jgi:hypothetical protein
MGLILQDSELVHCSMRCPQRMRRIKLSEMQAQKRRKKCHERWNCMGTGESIESNNSRRTGLSGHPDVDLAVGLMLGSPAHQLV